MCSISSAQKMASCDRTGYLTERETVKRLKHMGRKLPKYLASSVDKLLELLDKLELVLSTLDQEPTQIIQESLVPSMKALISNELLRHSDEDVKISVTTCLTEITRIIAPDAPYDDEQMKEILKVTVAAFEKLSCLSGRSYEKALTILVNVSKIRIFLIMLDLESNHPSNVIDSMESIMTMVLNESEEISPHLLRPLLDSVHKENQTISPISWTLGEKVITNCAVKLKPYLMQAVESSGRALNEYAQIVTSICQSQSECPQHDHSIGPKETVVTGVRDAQIMDDTKSNIQSASAATMDGEFVKNPGSKRKLHPVLTKNSKRSNTKSSSEAGNLESVQEMKSETQLNTVPGKRDRKPNSLMNPEEGYDHSWIYKVTPTGKSSLSRKTCGSSSVFPPSKTDKLQTKPKTFSDMSKVHEALVAEPKTDENTDSAPLTNHNIPNGSYSKRGRPRKISRTENQDVHHNSVSMSKDGILNPLLEKTSLGKKSEVRRDSEVKAQAPIRKIKISVKMDGRSAVMAPEPVVARMESEVSCEDEGTQKSSMNTKVENREVGRSSAQTEVKKRRRQNATPNKGLNKSSAMKGLTTESVSKTLSQDEETPQAGLRRRRTTVNVEGPESHELGNSLVGNRIKVWWPLDKRFYEGVIDSYDPVKGKHKILYDDGDEEMLNLKKQRWELVQVHVSPDGEEGLGL